METNNYKDGRDFIPITDKRPRWGQWVVVVTHSVPCLGFIDPEAGWRAASDGSPVEDVVGWCPYEAQKLVQPGGIRVVP